jgi:uncharacterized protein YegP (UPF0339 family)
VSTNEKAVFRAEAGNNEIIGTSQMCASCETRDGGMEAVKVNAPIAGVEGWR